MSARLAQLHRELAALVAEEARVQAAIAEEMAAAAPKEAPAPKRRRPHYTAPVETVSQVDKERAERALRGRGYEVR